MFEHLKSQTNIWIPYVGFLNALARICSIRNTFDVSNPLVKIQCPKHENWCKSRCIKDFKAKLHTNFLNILLGSFLIL